MATNVINAELLAKMFLAGAKNLESKKEYINELNVFPVPDGDTGTNMTLTIMSAAKELNNVNEKTMQTVCKAISSGSLRGARGNSGVILSQLIRGFTKVASEADEITIPVLAAACDKAVQTAYKAVMKPKEGTILTVAAGAATKAKELADNGCDNMEEFIGIFNCFYDLVSRNTNSIEQNGIHLLMEKMEYNKSQYNEQHKKLSDKEKVLMEVNRITDWNENVRFTESDLIL